MGTAARRPSASRARPAKPDDGLREIPQAVYAMLGSGGAPLTAYDLIENLQRRLARRLHPPTIYRALSQLVEKGLIHRLESGNSYVACASPGEPHHSILFVCNICGTAEEAVDSRVNALLKDDARRRQFDSQTTVIEVRGRCSECHAAD